MVRRGAWAGAAVGALVGVGVLVGVVSWVGSATTPLRWRDQDCANSTSELVRAASVGEHATLVSLLDVGEANAGPSQRTPLYCAVAAGRPDVAELLLQRGADPNVVSARKDDHSSDFPLNEAIRVGSRPMIDLLLRHGAQPDAAPEVDPLKGPGRVDRPFLIAVRGGQHDIVRTLVDHGADVNDPTEGLPLGEALRPDQPDLALLSLLLERGADPNANDGAFCPNFSLVVAGNAACGSVVSHALPHRVEALELLLDHGGDPTSGVYKAIVEDDRESLGVLLARGGNPNGPCARETTPLAYGVAFGNDDIVADLLDHGADPDLGGVAAADTVGVAAVLAGERFDRSRELATLGTAISGTAPNLPPVVIAAGLGRAGLLQRLLDHGADPDLAAEFKPPVDARQAASLSASADAIRVLDDHATRSPLEPGTVRAPARCPVKSAP